MLSRSLASQQYCSVEPAARLKLERRVSPTRESPCTSADSVRIGPRGRSLAKSRPAMIGYRVE